MPPNLLYRRHATSTLTPKREDTIMDTRTTPIIMRALLFTILLVAFAATAFAQTTTGTVSMSATVSKFVEFNSGGAITLSGNSGGGITTDGVVDNPLAASINLGELGPSNKIVNTDVGFGQGSVTRSGTGVNTGGSDTNATSGDPTLAGNGSINGA